MDKKNKIYDAEIIYKKSIEIDPKNIFALVNLARITRLINDLERISKKYNFNYFDLSTELVNNFNGKYEDLFFECDNHYNELGSKIISEIIAKQIK